MAKWYAEGEQVCAVLCARCASGPPARWGDCGQGHRWMHGNVLPDMCQAGKIRVLSRAEVVPVTDLRAVIGERIKALKAAPRGRPGTQARIAELRRLLATLSLTLSEEE